MDNSSAGYENFLLNEYTTSFDYEDVEFVCRTSDDKRLSSLFIPMFYSIITVIGIIGNGLVVFTYMFYKKVRTMTDMYLVNLAIADILLVVTLPFRAVDINEGWIFGDVGCKVLMGIYSINFNSGMLLLAVISIDRYVAIVHATKYFNYRGKALVYSEIICIAIWIAGIVVTMPTFIFSTSYKFNITGKTVCDIRYPKSYSNIGKAFATTIQLTLGFFIPLLIMVYCYSLIITTLLQARNFQRHKSFLVIIVVVATFVICQVPYNLVVVYDIFWTENCEEFKLMAIVRTVTKSFAFLHCCLNPVLYAFIGVKFRFYFLKILQDIWCLSKWNISARPSSDLFVSRRTCGFDSDNISSFTV